MHLNATKLFGLSLCLILLGWNIVGCTTTIIPIGPQISIDQEYFHFAVGDGLDPHPQTLRISNVGGGTLYWTATVDAPWISVAPTSGTAPSTIIVSVKVPEGAPKLIMGKRQGKITISSPAAINSPLTIWVNFKIFMQGRAAYIYNSDATIAEDYKTLFQKNGYEVDLIMQNDVLSTDLSRYMYVVIGPDTGKESQWGDAADNQARHVADSRKSCLGILGLGKGGAAFYSQLGVKISWANGIRGSSDSVYAASKDLPFWSFPYRISISEDLILKLYTKESSYIAIHQPIIVPDSPQLIPILKTLETQPDYPVIVETNSAFFYVLWGFDDGPSAMTLLGQRVFIDVLDSLPCAWAA